MLFVMLHIHTFMYLRHDIILFVRWTVKADALSSILANYQHLNNTWDESLEDCADSALRTRIFGIQAKMASFDYYFGKLSHDLNH